MDSYNKMEIIRLFKSTFIVAWVTKCRNFFRRSIFLYAFATMLITYGLHASDDSISSMEMFVRGGIYFCFLCLTVLLLLAIFAAIQTRRIKPVLVKFRENDLIAIYKDNIIARSWDWIVSAHSEPPYYWIKTRKFPSVFLVLSKDKLSEDENEMLQTWLLAHQKLKSHD